MPVPFRKTEKALSNGLCICMGHFCVWGWTLSVSLRSTASSPFCRLAGEGASGTNPLSLAALDSSPEGRALGKKGNSRPYRSTARRSQLISTKLYASAKASPFRERWHGGAVTERVCSRDENPWRDGVSAPDLHFLFFRQKLFFPFVQLRLIFCSLGDIWPVLVCKCRGVPP